MAITMNNETLNRNDKKKHLDILNVLQLNIYQMPILMFCTGQENIPAICQNRFIIFLIHIIHCLVRVVIMKNLSLKKAEDRHFRLYNEIDFS